MILTLHTELMVKETAEETRVTSPEEAEPIIKDMRDLAQECFCVLTLNTKNNLIKRNMVSIGTVDQSLVHPREVFRNAIAQSASSIILVHNHPSGDPSPSAQDIKITKKLVEVGELIGISVLDHLIVGKDILSLRESCLVDFL